jgi:hypothetical protein
VAAASGATFRFWNSFVSRAVDTGANAWTVLPGLIWFAPVTLACSVVSPISRPEPRAALLSPALAAVWYAWVISFDSAVPSPPEFTLAPAKAISLSTTRMSPTCRAPAWTAVPVL